VGGLDGSVVLLLLGGTLVNQSAESGVRDNGQSVSTVRQRPRCERSSTHWYSEMVSFWAKVLLFCKLLKCLLLCNLMGVTSLWILGALV
jgi:hypothetical protein